MIRISKLFMALLLLCFAANMEAQKRSRPGSMKHNESEIKAALEGEPVKCTYVSSGHTFKGNVYFSGGSDARMKVGSATISFSGNHYTLSFKAAKFEMRDGTYSGDKHRYNPWRQEKLANDFTQQGKYETFKKGGKVYLRLFYEDTLNYMDDFPLDGISAKEFIIGDGGLKFEFNL